MNDVWKLVDFSEYDMVFHVAGIAHVDPKPSMAPLFHKKVYSHNNFKKQMPKFEAIHEGETDSFFSEGDVVSLTNCIQRWLSTKFDRNSIREKCYRVVDEYYNPSKQIDIIRKVIFK